MIALFLVLIASLLVAGVFLGGFLWSVKRDQFEDKEGAALRMLHDDNMPIPFPENAASKPASPRF